MEPTLAPSQLSGGLIIPSTNVEISVSCRNLCDLDTFSKSDPMVVLFEKDGIADIWREIGRTEVVWNNLNPDFVKKFILTYHFEECQKLKFEVYDVDSHSNDLTKHDFCGRTETTLGEIVSSGRLEKKLSGGPNRNNGSVISVSAEEASSCKDEISLQFYGSKLDKKDFFGLSDPFLAFSRINEDSSRTVCYRTEAIKNTLNPKWKRFTLPVRLLCNGDLDRTIWVECFDWNRSGSHSLIGEFSTTLRQFLKWPSFVPDFALINNNKKSKKKSYSNSGMIKLVYCEKKEVHSFLDYIRGGTEINCTIAIDFTASNGNPQQPGTLHFLNPYQPTQYAMALQSIGQIIQDYDSDNMYPVFGFGAKLPPYFDVSHCFPLTFDPSNPFCQGIPNVLNLYHNALQRIQLYGPTNFAPIINHAAGIARQVADGSQYFILLVLTDGIITDLNLTKKAIVEASTLPLSIIIVGIGDADFQAMDELDGDEERVSYNGQLAARDIVQFVPFRNFFKQNQTSGNVLLAQKLLAKEVLMEIPDQIVGYMRTRGIRPNPASNRVNRQIVGSTVSNNVAVQSVVGAVGGVAPDYEAPPPYRA